VDINKEIAIYKSKDEKVKLDVNLKDETVWLSQKQLSELFGVERSVVTKHIGNVFKEKELDKKSNVQKMHIANSDKLVFFFNLDVIISVGYRIKSKRGTEFRIWATNILKRYLLDGYVKKEDKKFKQLSDVVSVITHIVDQRKLDSDEAVSLLKVIADYTQALDLLDRYDHKTLKLERSKLSKRVAREVDYEEATSIIQQLAKSFGGSSLFGKEKDKSFRSSIEGIYQTFGGKELYPSIEEKASNLLYFLVKNHSFIDGNKRIPKSSKLVNLNF